MEKFRQTLNNLNLSKEQVQRVIDAVPKYDDKIKDLEDKIKELEEKNDEDYLVYEDERDLTIIMGGWPSYFNLLIEDETINENIEYDLETNIAKFKKPIKFKFGPNGQTYQTFIIKDNNICVAVNSNNKTVTISSCSDTIHLPLHQYFYTAEFYCNITVKGNKESHLYIKSLA